MNDQASLEQETYSKIETRMKSSLSRALLAILCKRKFVCDIDYNDLSDHVLADLVLIEFSDKIVWSKILEKQTLSVNVVRRCHKHFMTQEYYSKVEKSLASEVEKLKWALLFNFYYTIDVDFSALSRENVPNIFIAMFAHALNWSDLLKYSSIDADLLEKHSDLWITVENFL